MQQKKHEVNWSPVEKLAIKLFDGDPTLQSARDRWFSSFAVVANKLGLSPNVISLLGVVITIFAGLVMNNYLLSGSLVLFGLFLDGIDGVVARKYSQESADGEIVDVVCDTIGMCWLAFCATSFDLLPSQIALFYGAVVVPYSIISSLRSKILIGKYRSVGSRMLVTSGLGVCLSALGLGVISEGSAVSLCWWIFTVSGSIMLLSTIFSYKSAFAALIRPFSVKPN